MLIYLLELAPDGALASDGMLLMSRAGVLVNVVLMVLNLLPIPPLDGGRIAISLLPHSLAAGYARLEPYGFMIYSGAARDERPGSADVADDFPGATRCCRCWSASSRASVPRRHAMFSDRVLSGMRPTGRMHIGHYHGALKNWLRLQEEYECLYFAADWHALTTHYETPERIEDSVWEMFIDWLAAGINPTRSTIFIQSRVVEHAELTLLLGMIAPVGWLERVPTYKDQQQKLADRDLTTFGFLGYPVMQAADILIYRANMVPVGEDQVSHLELVRELARRFNHIYGREADFEEKARAAIKKLGSKRAKRYAQLRTAFQEQGDQAALETARDMLDEAQNLALGDRERLFGYLEGSRRVILPEPHPLLTDTPKVPGTDGQKMSKSYDNAIFLREDPATITTKVRTMQTDPARVHRSDPGTPRKVSGLVAAPDLLGSDNPGLGAQRMHDRRHRLPRLQAAGDRRDHRRAAPLHERAQKYLDDPSLVRAIVADGCERARKLAEETMRDVREAMGLGYT